MELKTSKVKKAAQHNVVKKKLVLGAHFNLAAFGFSLLLGFCTIGFDSLHIFPLRSRFYIPVKRRDY